MTESFNIKEALNALDNKAIDEGLKFYDLRDLYEAVNPYMSDREKLNLRTLIEAEDSKNISRYLGSRLDKEYADLDECDKQPINEASTDIDASAIVDAMDELNDAWSNFRACVAALGVALGDVYNLRAFEVYVSDFDQTISDELEDITDEVLIANSFED